MMSVAPPGVKATITRTGLVGYACAKPQHSATRSSASFTMRSVESAAFRLHTMFAPNLLAQSDPELWHAIQLENQRQEDHVELIASENYVSRQVLIAQGSQLTNKYAEGYPGTRYYGGREDRDSTETTASWRRDQTMARACAN